MKPQLLKKRFPKNNEHPTTAPARLLDPARGVGQILTGMLTVHVFVVSKEQI
jgi:hypothetical protein